MADVKPPAGVEVTGPAVPGAERILTPEALAFVADLQRRFGAFRLDVLERRKERQAELDAGVEHGQLQVLFPRGQREHGWRSLSACSPTRIVQRWSPPSDSLGF